MGVMGEVLVKAKFFKNDKVEEVEAIVDTGSTFTKIPKNVADKLGIEGKEEVKVKIGDGKIISRKLDIVEIEIEGIKRQIYVTIGGESEVPVIGYTTLEILGLKVNPVERKLEKVTAIELKEVKWALN